MNSRLYILLVFLDRNQVNMNLSQPSHLLKYNEIDDEDDDGYYKNKKCFY
jgi:hypothetical protein